MQTPVIKVARRDTHGNLMSEQHRVLGDLAVEYRMGRRARPVVGMLYCHNALLFSPSLIEYNRDATFLLCAADVPSTRRENFGVVLSFVDRKSVYRYWGEEQQMINQWQCRTLHAHWITPILDITPDMLAIDEFLTDNRELAITKPLSSWATIANSRNAAQIANLVDRITLRKVIS